MTNKVRVRVKKLQDDVALPKYARKGDAGFDLVAANDVIIEPGETIAVPTGLAFAVPEGYEIQVRPRSGLSLNTRLRVANAPGTIDSGYRGELAVLLSNEDFIEDGGLTVIIRKGDRIAQGVLAEVPTASFEEVDELDETERGSKGFGSTGSN